jgi:TRAP transporter TAXI family solute receptor
MKSLKIVLIILVSVLALSTSGFSASKRIATVYTSGVGGTAYVLGGAIAKVINKHVPEVQMVVEATGGTIASVRFIAEKYEKNQEAFGLSDSQGLHFAYEGKKPFTQRYEMIRAMTFLYGSGVNLVVPKNSPIKSYADLKGKKVAIGPAGSGLATMSVDLIGAHGVPKEMYKYIYLGFKEVPEGIKDGSIDAGFVAGSYPVPALVELGLQKELRIVPVEEKVLKKILSESPFFAMDTLKPGAYRGVEKETPILVFGIVLETHSKSDPEFIYRITKALFEHKDELIEIHTVAKEISLASAMRTITFPLHPGAEKYFKEVGVLKK